MKSRQSSSSSSRTAVRLSSSRWVGQGSLLATAEVCERFAAIPVEARSTVGAGDSMLAGIVLALLARAADV
jgi:fructose-1-phosphate kinase PfkB-like protein